MSTLGGDLEQNALIDLDPLVGVHRPSPGGSSARPHEDSGEERAWKEDLCHAICGNKWSDAKAILDQNPNALTSVVSHNGRTALHVAAMIGHVTIVEELLKLLPPQFLLTLDSDGNTALVMASWFSGNTEVAKCLVSKNSRVLEIPDMVGDLPVIVAFAKGYQEMGRYLYFVTPMECLPGRWGSRLLLHCLHAQCFDIALNLLQQCEELLLVPFNNLGTTPIRLPVMFAWTSDKKIEVKGIKKNLPRQIKLTKRSMCDAYQCRSKKIQELKLLHAQADELLLLVCKNAGKAYQKGVIKEALCLAAKEGNVEFVFQVSKVIPEIFLDQTLLMCFDEALHYRQARVFNLIHGLRFKHGLVTTTPDHNGNYLMHKAAMKAPDHVLNRIYAPTLQMQRELQWFKEVESLTPPSYRIFRNKNGMTAEELFRGSHGELMKQGEKWIKTTASSCSVVGTLIVTIMFAVAFTVPGGNDQNLGYPLFIKQPFFKVFIFSTILSLLSSSTSVLMFLAILTSQFSEEKFLKSLPTKLILGLSFLFISIVSMIVAFLCTIRLMLKHTNYSWGVLPITILASVPIVLFVMSEFPLLLHTFVSTYGNIFDRKVEPWP
ncbi:uncharacterized protein LOC114721601 [Neltuma alba]|uniref:uncharacterized protein LOC114721601 n=1 Tax=Neltuma alba TaxID=207710 RepID=UPI0010A35373|nr:uncharacterized protein LOC114721601 [Prosopis alba]